MDATGATLADGYGLLVAATSVASEQKRKNHLRLQPPQWRSGDFIFAQAPRRARVLISGTRPGQPLSEQSTALGTAILGCVRSKSTSNPARVNRLHDTFGCPAEAPTIA
ncbi:unnamed protein product, partial [Iphiclides podalirius]